MYNLVKQVAFRMDAEFVHEFAVRLMPALSVFTAASSRIDDERLPLEVAGIRFPSPVGLAAGFDKAAECFHCLHRFGFGFAEVGTFTPRPQDGNPKPRLFRHPPARALLNRMGFNNPGSRYGAERLSSRKSAIPIGANLGKNKTTPNEKAAEDYAIAFRDLAPHADYIAVNVSSPNTVGLRDLQSVKSLEEILNALHAENNELGRPIFLKLAPDLADETLLEVAEAAPQMGLAGLIATNTTLDHSSLPEGMRQEAGGVSGAPLADRALQVLAMLAKKIDGKIALVSSGGIVNPGDLAERISFGADLVQVYSGWVFAGPAFAVTLQRELLKELDRRNCTLHELKGCRL